MDTKTNTTPPQSPIILPFSPDKPPPRLSIPIDDVDIGIFYEEYYSMVKDRCRAVLRNEEEARDTAQDVFEKLLVLKANGQLHVTYPKTYLSRAATNMGINKKKRNELIQVYDLSTDEILASLRNKGGEANEEWETSITEKGYEQEEAKLIVQSIVDEQDEITRKIYFYSFHEDMTVRQIAEIVGLKKSSVQERINKLKELVKVKIGKVNN